MADGDASAELAEPSWVLCIASIVFDIDQGQRLESLHPTRSLTPAEVRDVAFHSFPDSMSLELHSRSSIKDSTFFFRVKRQASSDARPSPADSDDRSASSSQASTSGREHYHNQKQKYLYGFVFCRQRQDSRLKRGGEQKSLVLLSHGPFSSVLSPASQWAGPLYFNQGAAALPMIYRSIMAWVAPQPGLRQTVLAGSLALTATIPDSLALPPPALLTRQGELSEMQLEEALPPLDRLQGAFAEVDVHTPLRAVLDKAWALWELTVLAEPLMVFAPSPGEACRAVVGLIAMIAPLPYSADFRPYFTIHDAAFHELSRGVLPDKSTGLPRLLGVTNLYFLKALPKWPNILSTGTKPLQSSSEGSLGDGKNGSESRLSKLDQVMRRRSGGAHVLLSRHIEALWLSYKPLTKPDKALLERLLAPQAGADPEKLGRIAAANSSALRKHFGQLTAAFLQPFERFVQPAQPPPGEEPLPASGAPHLPAFSYAEFLDGLQREELPALLLDRFGNKAACLAFYRRFLECPNFTSWFERRRGVAAAWQEAAWKRAEHERGTQFALDGSSEVHLVEAFGALERRLDAAAAATTAPFAPQNAQIRVASLQKQMNGLYQKMPRDLQTCILSSPSRAALLHRLSPSVKVPGQPRMLTPTAGYSDENL